MTWRRREFELLLVAVPLTALVVTFWLVTFVAYFDPNKLMFGSTDLLEYFYPKFAYGASALVRGRLPLWNPHELCGMPFVATAQVAALYPVKNLFFAVLPPWLALHVNYVFHFVLAGVCAWAYARWRGFGARAATIAAVMWTFNPTFVQSQYHPNRIMVLSWLPLVLLVWERALARRTLGSAALAGAVIGLQCTAGYPPFTLCIAVYLGLYLIWETVAAARAGRGALGVVGAALATAVFAGAFAAPQVLPTAELLGHSTRRDLVAEWASYSPPAPIDWTTPRAVALPVVMALVLAPGALAGFGLAGAASMGLGAGYYVAALVLGETIGAVAATVLAGVPGYSLIRAAGYIWVMFAPFFVGMLTALGVERALERGAGGRIVATLLVGAPLLQSALLWFVVRLFLATLPMAVAGQTARSTFDFHAWFLRQILMATVVAALGALVIAGRRRTWLRTPVFAAYLGIFVWGVFAAERFPDGAVPYPTVGPRRELHALADRAGKRRVFAPRLVGHGEQMLSELPEVSGSEGSLHPARVGRLLAEAGIRDFNPDWAAMGAHRRLIDLLGVALIVVDDPAAVRGAGFLRASNLPDGSAMFRNPTGLPRAFVVHRARAAATPDDAFAAVVAPEFQPGEEAVVEGAAPLLAASSARPVVTWVADEPERLELEVSVGAPGLLVVTDALFPGWNAKVDGAAAPILRTDYAFRGIVVESGTHRVVMHYRPWSFWGGVLLASAAAAVALGARRRAPRAASPVSLDATSRMTA